MSVYLDRAEAAAYLGIGITLFKEEVQAAAIREGWIIRIGARVKFDRADLDAWVARQKQHGASTGSADGPTSTSPAKASLIDLGPGLGLADRLRRPPRNPTPRSPPADVPRSRDSRRS